MRAPLVALLLAALAACGSGKKSSTQPNDPDRGSNDGSAGTIAPGVTVADCTNLISHALKLRVAEVGSGSNGPVSEAEEKQLRDQVGAAVDQDCHKLTPAQVKCGMAATTVDAFTACDTAKPDPTKPDPTRPGQAK